MTEKQLINKFNKIADKHRKLKSRLQDLTDKELYIWIAGKTYKYGRSAEDSLKNAECHMENREEAEKRFGFKHEDCLI